MVKDTAEMPRRSAGQVLVARALWYVAPGQAELRTERLPPPAPGEVRVQTLYSAVSRGTERLVCNGAIPETEWPRMRAPNQAGSFPFPVKYGYAAVGTVTAGTADLLGRTVFSLYPHQDFMQGPASLFSTIPEDIPARRATLAANMETALNAHWDAGTGPGDRILVIGAGVVGLLVAALAAVIPGTTVTLVDIDQSKQPLAESLGAAFATPNAAPDDQDAVFHTSASTAGLQLAIDKAGFEAKIVEMSWYGGAITPISLGGAYHSRRLHLISSQVGYVSPLRRPRWPHSRRLAAAINLLRIPALDRLVEGEVSFDSLPHALPELLGADARGLPPIIRY